MLVICKESQSTNKEMLLVFIYISFVVIGQTHQFAASVFLPVQVFIFFIIKNAFVMIRYDIIFIRMISGGWWGQ